MTLFESWANSNHARYRAHELRIRAIGYLFILSMFCINAGAFISNWFMVDLMMRGVIAGVGFFILSLIGALLEGIYLACSLVGAKRRKQKHP
jgi:hypothetical protein